MRLRTIGLIVTLALGILFPPLADAQPPAKIPRVGLLSVGADPSRPVVWLPFLERLRELGYVEGQHIAIERRFADGRRERLPEFVADLARLKVDVVVATGTSENLAAKQALPTIPIVMMLVADPVGAGLVANLARPGGNVTGLSTISVELSAKRLELLKEVVPGIRGVAVLSNPANSLTAPQLRETEVAARTLGLQLRLQEARNTDELAKAFSAITRERIDALIVILDAVFFNARGRIAEFTAKNRLPAMFASREFVEAGGLMAYGASFSDLSRRAADYLDKILKGAKPADLPVEQPTRFELVVNLKTAKALGLTIPQSILIRADKVIE